MNEFNEIIDKIGKILNVKITHLSDNWLTILERDNQIHYIQGYKFDLNNHGIGNIMDDKGLFFDLLTYKNIPCVYQKVIFSDYSKEDVIKFFNKYNNNIIIKGNIGTCGKEVYRINNENDLFNVLNKLFLSQFSVSLSPFINAKNEYRVIVLNGEARIVYGKIKPTIVGDGKKTIYELAVEFNKFFELNKNEIINPNTIPKDGEIITINYQFNLSKGAKMFRNIDDKLKKQLIELALRVTNELDITFGSVDILYTDDNQLLVLEANSGVMMDNFIKQNDDGYDIAFNLYCDAIKLMFDLKE